MRGRDGRGVREEGEGEEGRRVREESEGGEESEGR